MRLWSIHPEYLDAKGLTALWREGLLARKVLVGQTRGYQNHPQLARFRGHNNPLACIEIYLQGVHEESERRGYRFDSTKLCHVSRREHINVTTGQIQYEWEHLQRKLSLRDPEWSLKWISITRPRPHPLFRIVPGEIESWERTYE